MPKNWKPAPAIAQLMKQVNAAFPFRDKKSDGVVGNAEHAARKSEHNPDAHGVVRAWDCTHNPQMGVDCRQFLAALLAAKDSRIWYIIFEGRIYNRKVGFKPEKYTGSNAHNHHLHISVANAPDVYNQAQSWDLGDFTKGVTTTAPAIEKPTTPLVNAVRDLKQGDDGEDVAKLQLALHTRGFLDKDNLDGIFGPNTKKAVVSFQVSRNLRADGIVGKNTRGALNL